jgi:hypothetical protein
MSEMRDKLQQLLDGELDPSDIADDAALVSLADRLYGIKIAPVKPVKARDFVSAGINQSVTEVAPPTDMLIEVIAPIGLPNANLPHLDMPDLPNAKSGSSKILKVFSISSLLLVIVNIFGLLSNILGPLCDINDNCRGSEQTRINLMSIHKIGSTEGWSYSVLNDQMSGVGGSLGGIGIPDIVALTVLVIISFMVFRKK